MYVWDFNVKEDMNVGGWRKEEIRNEREDEWREGEGDAGGKAFTPEEMLCYWLFLLLVHLGTKWWGYL